MAKLSFSDRYFTPKRAIPKPVEISTGLVVAAAILIGWYLATATGFVSRDFLPSPGDVWASFLDKLGDGSLKKHIGVSLTEIYLGFFLSSIIAIPIGIFMGGFRIVACNKGKGNEKGRVESGVGYVKKNFLNGLDICDFSALNAAVLQTISGASESWACWPAMRAYSIAVRGG